MRVAPVSSMSISTQIPPDYCDNLPSGDGWRGCVGPPGDVRRQAEGWTCAVPTVRCLQCSGQGWRPLLCAMVLEQIWSRGNADDCRHRWVRVCQPGALAVRECPREGVAGQCRAVASRRRGYVVA